MLYLWDREYPVYETSTGAGISSRIAIDPMASRGLHYQAAAKSYRAGMVWSDGADR